MAKPVFIVGCNRSGTTWLANILCNNSQIAGIQHQMHDGIHESSFFSHILDRYGDLNLDTNYIELVETFTKSDYFILSGLDKNIFYKQRPMNYYSFFRLLMDCYAEKNKSAFWLEKTPMHTLYVDKLLEMYPDAKFITITRKLDETVNSFIKMLIDKNELFNKKRGILQIVYRYVIYSKFINHFSIKYGDRIYGISYFQLKNSKEETVKRICNFLGLKFEDTMLEDSFMANTSFNDFTSNNGDNKKDSFLSFSETLEMKLLYRIFHLIPYCFFKLYRILKKKNQHKNRVILPDYFYRIKIEEVKSMNN